MDSHHFIAELWTSQGRWEGVHSQLHHPFPPLGHILPAQTLLLGENSSVFWCQEGKVKGMWVHWPGHCQPQQSLLRRPQESSLLPLPDNISPAFHSGRNLCRGLGLENLSARTG